MFVVPQFQITFRYGDQPQAGVQIAWVVSGEEALDTICKVLRWNGIKEYAVKPYDFDSGPKESDGK